ncbi:UNKNOWN [Stylonychia lemnae]|uniref:Uncharacterized protein n=1 Tax=Stylonychia lemnae TaxID=5949 RepID=A0A077ZS91_STYLE|nr:UNKNOWN [Stylonychia lemnae]|eukprot:CDW72747.1 UNKNOWN [Stylonychia lemnae]
MERRNHNNNANQQQFQEEINLSSEGNHNHNQDSMDDAQIDDDGSDMDVGPNLGDALTKNNFQNRNVFQDKYKDRSDRKANNHNHNNKKNPEQQQNHEHQQPLENNGNVYDEEVQQQFIQMDEKKKQDIEEILKIVGDRDYAVVSQVYDDLQYLINGQIDEEALRQVEQNRVQNMKSAFQGFDEDFSSQRQDIAGVDGQYDDEEYARRLMEQELLKQQLREQRKIEGQRRIEESIRKQQSNQSRNSNPNRNGSHAQNSHQLNGYEDHIFDPDQMIQSSQINGQRNSKPASQMNQQQKNGKSIQKQDNNKDKAGGGGGFLGIFGCCGSKKPKQNDKSKNAKDREQRYIQEESLDNIDDNRQ